MMPSKALQVVTCPHCGIEHQWDTNNRFRPFCSERCKNIDIGAWASENFRMPADAPPDDQDFGDPKLQ